MTEAGSYEKAWRLGFKRDFSLVDELYDPDCTHFDHRVGLEVNMDM
jgi:hypothetical protein